MSKEINGSKFICIMCPLGCEVTVRSDAAGSITEVIGNKCPKGDKYAREEFKTPRRVLTSTIAIEDASYPRLPVRTSATIPKDRIFDCMDEIKKAKVKGPVETGRILIKNILGLGADVIATRRL